MVYMYIEQDHVALIYGEESSSYLALWNRMCGLIAGIQPWLRCPDTFDQITL